MGNDGDVATVLEAAHVGSYKGLKFFVCFFSLQSMSALLEQYKTVQWNTIKEH